jgi:hypothetical protein
MFTTTVFRSFLDQVSAAGGIIYGEYVHHHIIQEDFSPGDISVWFKTDAQASKFIGVMADSLVSDTMVPVIPNKFPYILVLGSKRLEFNLFIYDSLEQEIMFDVDTLVYEAGCVKTVLPAYRYLGTIEKLTGDIKSKNAALLVVTPESEARANEYEKLGWRTNRRRKVVPEEIKVSDIFRHIHTADGRIYGDYVLNSGSIINVWFKNEDRARTFKSLIKDPELGNEIVLGDITLLIVVFSHFPIYHFDVQALTIKKIENGLIKYESQSKDSDKYLLACIERKEATVARNLSSVDVKYNLPGKWRYKMYLN